MIRLQKAMADRGVASRRHAEELIAEGRVRVDGETVTTLGTKVPADARIEVDGRPVAPPPQHRHVLLNKPFGVVSTASDERGRRTVLDVVGARDRLYPVGRLDADSEGLLLLTNDGAWAEHVIHPRYGHEREYEVAVEGDLSDAALAKLRAGVRLEEGLARAVRISVHSRSHDRARFAIVLHTGWKRQVRRMCAAVGLKVTKLVRVRIGPLLLGRLRPGEWRDLTKREVDALTAPAPRVTRRMGSRASESGGGPAIATIVRRAQGGEANSRARGPRAAAGPAARSSRRRAFSVRPAARAARA
ncbi:MAG TPA: pseudouridine synthase [Candidatus Limnocylindria bacterium]|nr:pseudouridine synthase [Candidatus Limnocylindria bacterium]